MDKALARRGRKQPPRDRVTGRLSSFPGPLAASSLASREVASLGLPEEPGIMYLRLQRERVWSEATRARAARRRRGADAGTFWEDARFPELDPPPELSPVEGELLHLRGAERHATTRVLRVEPLAPHTVVVACASVVGLHIPRAAPA